MSDSVQEHGPRIAAQMPEFRAAVDAAVAEQMKTLLPEMMAGLAKAQAQTGSASPGASDDKNFVSALALQLAELTGQGMGRIYVAPEVIEERRTALKRLKRLLLELWAKSERGRIEEYTPVYRLTNKVYLNVGGAVGEMVVEPLYRDNLKIVQPQEISFMGIPNGAMQPINEPARKVHGLFCEWTGALGTSSDEPDELLAITTQGLVVRGDAARAVMRGQEGTAAPSAGENGMVGIRRADKAPVQRIQVLGTLTKPVEVS